MSLNQNSVRGNYLLGVSNLIDERLVDEDFVNTVRSINIPTECNLADAYFYITFDLIRKRESKGNLLSAPLKVGLAESISQKLWLTNIDSIGNSRDQNNDNWVQRQVADLLSGTIGDEELTTIALKHPDLLGELLFSIDYKDTNLLDYLNRHLRKACQFGLNPRFQDVEHSFDLLNCCEAIIDCSSELKLPSRQKNKVKEKARKRQNERDFE